MDQNKERCGGIQDIFYAVARNMGVVVTDDTLFDCSDVAVSDEATAIRQEEGGVFFRARSKKREPRTAAKTDR